MTSEPAVQPTSEKYVLRFFFDWGSGPLWSENDKAEEKFGAGPINPDKLPVSASTAKELDELNKRHSEMCNWSEGQCPWHWRQTEADQFNERVRQAYEKLVEELGSDFVVVDEYEPVAEDPDLDEYLNDSEGYWQRRLIREKLEKKPPSLRPLFRVLYWLKTASKKR